MTEVKELRSLSKVEGKAKTWRGEIESRERGAHNPVSNGTSLTVSSANGGTANFCLHRWLDEQLSPHSEDQPDLAKSPAHQPRAQALRITQPLIEPGRRGPGGLEQRACRGRAAVGFCFPPDLDSSFRVMHPQQHSTVNVIIPSAASVAFPPYALYVRPIRTVLLSYGLSLTLVQAHRRNSSHS